MDDTQYYLDPPTQIMRLMKKTFGDRYTYYLGSPTFEFAEVAYPVLVVQSVQSANTQKNAPTSTDRVRELIKVYFFEQSKDYVGASEDQQTAIRVPYNSIQGRDPATGRYYAKTAMGALRANLDLGSAATGIQTTIDHDITIDYDIIPRANQPTIVEAIVTVVTDERVIVVR